MPFQFFIQPEWFGGTANVVPDSIHRILLEGAQDVIQGLSLTGVTSTNVVLQTTPTDRTQWLAALPGICIAPFGQETFPGGTNASDDIGYPILIGIVDAANQDQETSSDRRLYWRERMIDQFIENRMSVTLTNAVLFNQVIEPLSVVDAQAWFGKNLYVSPFVVRCLVRKLRRAS